MPGDPAFVDLLNEDYPLGHSWIEGQYKEALKVTT